MKQLLEYYFVYFFNNAEEEMKKKEFIVIIAIIIMLLCIGIFVSSEKAKKHEDEKKKQERLAEIDNRIETLSKEKEKKEKIEKQDRKFFLIARRIIGIILIIANLSYLHFCLNTFILNSLLNFNEAILLIYTFVAYIFYGTIENLVKELKLKSIHIFRKNNFDSIKELEMLEKERKSLRNSLIIG